MRTPCPVEAPCRPQSRAIAVAIVVVAMAVSAGWGGVRMALGQQVDLPQDQTGAAAVEILELRTALKVAQKQLQEEKVRGAEIEARRLALAQSLAAANAEAESNREAYKELLIKLEGLGVDILDPDPRGLESRLLKAVRDRDLLERELAGVTEQLFKLTETFMSYMQTATSDDAEASQQIAAELLATERLFRAGIDGGKPGKVRAIAEGKVVSLDPEIGLVVLNIGKQSGVRVGMPLELLRVDRPIGDGLVVSVRDSICGVVIRELIATDEDIKVGDRVRPQADTL